ncbi:glutathione S-transferase family protein [Novosphingobium colocasiae]|uniref:Glutathione S-transferase n=1 Tax=Novosphingobium colocasiae TaxID=1256513 RepID=A0A918PK94_9SPHN|nr:glutathione S-transferase family protein [Novosphingobium colocasiae]GGZ13718.1 glutathione S-transferase [Novosphingobium colocasiae]
MPIDPQAKLEITAFSWVPPFAHGLVRDLRVRWACEELGLPYRERLVSAMDRPEWYYAEQPWGQVPYLRDGEVTLFESGAILLHIAESTGRLLAPSGQERACALSWLFAAFNSVEPGLFELSNINTFSKNEEWAKLRKPSLLAAVGQRLDRMQAQLGDFEWLAGAFSIADIAMVTVLRNLALADMLVDRPALAAYVERGTARPAFQTALADQLAAFARNAPEPART